MEPTLRQLVDIEQIRLLLEAHHKITGIASAVVDVNENVLVAVGWQDVSSFGGAPAVGNTPCIEAEPGRCVAAPARGPQGAQWEVALPIVVEGRHLGTFFTGKLSGTDPESGAPLLSALRLPRPGDGGDPAAEMKHLIDFFHVLVQLMAQMGGSNLELLREVEERHKAERSHRELRGFLEKIVNSISDPIFVKDREHRLVLVNEAVCALAGVRRDDLVGLRNGEISLADEVDALWETDEAVFATGEETVREEEVTDAQGGRRVVLTKKSLYRGADGKSYLVGIIRDITERKRAEEDIALLNFALDNVHEAAYLMDEQSRFLYVNEAACRALEYLREELLSMSLSEIAPDRPLDQWRRDWEELKEAGCLTFESRHRTRSGRIFPVEITANYFEYDSTGYTLALVRDLSQPHQAPPP